jgi:hypothetical protein
MVRVNGIVILFRYRSVALITELSRNLQIVEDYEIVYVNCHMISAIAHNGSAVELVGVRVAVPRFLPVPVDGWKFLFKMKLSKRYQVRVTDVSFGSR